MRPARGVKRGSREDNHKAAQALYFMHYNFARIHKTLRVTPAMEAGVSDRVWSLGYTPGYSASRAISSSRPLL